MKEVTKGEKRKIERKKIREVKSKKEKKRRKIWEEGMKKGEKE